MKKIDELISEFNDKPAAHEAYNAASNELRIRLALVLEKLDYDTPLMIANINWGHAVNATILLSQAKKMCKFLKVDEQLVAKGYGE
jgi:hypothetical protein